MPRPVGIGLKPDFAAGPLRRVLAQRRVRRPGKEHLEPAGLGSPETQELSGLSVDMPLLDGSGCAACQDSGYKGRLGIYELLEVDRTLAAMVSESCTDRDLAATAAERGYGTPWNDGLVQVEREHNTLRELPCFRPRDEPDEETT